MSSGDQRGLARRSRWVSASRLEWTSAESAAIVSASASRSSDRAPGGSSDQRVGQVDVTAGQNQRDDGAQPVTHQDVDLAGEAFGNALDDGRHVQRSVDARLPAVARQVESGDGPAEVGEGWPDPPPGRGVRHLAVQEDDPTARAAERLPPKSHVGHPSGRGRHLTTAGTTFSYARRRPGARRAGPARPVEPWGELGKTGAQATLPGDTSPGHAVACAENREAADEQPDP